VRINAIPIAMAQGNAFGYSYVRKTILEGLEDLGVEIVGDDSEICPIMLAITDPQGFYKHTKDQSLIALTMFETTVLPPHMTQSIYACDGVMVPSGHNLRMVRDSGLDLPAVVIPMGVDPSVYAPRERPERETFTFLWNGATNTRKGFIEAYRAFCELAPEMPGAELVIKTTPNP
jgi:glycosyltransferase involved in cell wall biosynthesis